KDTLLKPAITAIGPQNFKQITAKTFFNSEWNDYLQSVILRINEAHPRGRVPIRVLRRYQGRDHEPTGSSLDQHQACSAVRGCERVRRGDDVEPSRRAVPRARRSPALRLRLDPNSGGISPAI